MPDINDYIPEYTPLWRGEEQCNKSDCINIPADSTFKFLIPKPTNGGATTYQLFIDLNGNQGYIIFDTGEVVGDYFYATFETNSNGYFAVQLVEGGEIQVPCGCYQVELGTLTILFPDTFVSLLGIKWTFNFVCPNECTDPLLEINYTLDCEDEPLDYNLFLSGALVRQPLELADEVNAIDGTGRSRRVFSRLQTNKELRIRPLTLATHELLEGILNLPSFTIDGTEYTPAEGEVYTYVDAGTSGYYVGRVGLSASGKVLRLCCDEISPSS
jgi:hypothetical protein